MCGDVRPFLYLDIRPRTSKGTFPTYDDDEDGEESIAFELVYIKCVRYIDHARYPLHVKIRLLRTKHWTIRTVCVCVCFVVSSNPAFMLSRGAGPCQPCSPPNLLTEIDAGLSSVTPPRTAAVIARFGHLLSAC